MKNKVLASFEDALRTHCVDVFVRADGTCGFEEFRSESDGDGRWQSLARYSQLVFATGALAFGAAQRQVTWLDKTVVWRW